MATHSSDPAWRIPGTGEPCGLPSMGLHRVGHDWSDLAAAAAAVHIYNGLLLSHEKEQNPVIYRDVDGATDCHTEWSKPERKTPIQYTNTAAAKSLQSCPTLCDPIDGSPPGSPVPGILQARTLEGVAISFSNAWKWKVKVKLLSRVQLFATPWTAAYQAPPSMGFSRQEYWSGVPLPSPCKPEVWAHVWLTL